MAKDKNSAIDKLKKDKNLKPIPKKDQSKINGGIRKKRRWNKGCGGIIPQWLIGYSDLEKSFEIRIKQDYIQLNVVLFLLDRPKNLFPFKSSNY